MKRRMSQLGPYVERREIHCGRCYALLRVRGADGAPRVLKVVRSARDAAKKAALLRQEHDVLSGLAVPGVVRCLGLGVLDGATALVLEDAGPHDLRAWLRRRPLGIDAFLPRAIQLADTVAGLHGKRVIHRDLDPTNVVVSEDGERLTIIDFALATSVAGAEGSVAAGDREGTLRAISPEQTGRLGRPVDHRADLYALGAIFYEMLAGRPPFSAADPVELVHAHLARAPAPLAEIRPEVPRVLGDVVLKLLAKMPEQRYQSAEALAADLREIERRARASAVIEPFELGRIDLERELAAPGRLYGREREIDQLSAAFERVTEGASEVCLVTGGAGVGKSSLVREILGVASARGARCLVAKFGELRGNAPYAPVVEATRDLVRALAREPGAAAWRSRIREALDSSASVLAALVPEIADLLGVAAPAPGMEAERRFPFAFQRFVQALASGEGPVVLFLDDLQWADAASLRLLHVLAVPETRRLLLVGALRDGAEAPALASTVAALQGAAIPVRRISLSPLDLDALTALAADTLREAPDRVRPLAAVLQQKTAGNPFFVARFLRHLQRSGLLAFDHDRGAWDWDERRIAAAPVTENVAALMVETIRTLPAETQRALEMAACLPERIELDLLAAVSGTPVDDTARALWSALREGLLVPEVGPRPPAASGGDPCGAEGAPPSAVYRFAHDRVREAAYSLLSADERRRVHLAAGWKLHERGAARLFDAVDQLDRGVDRVVAPEERLAIADLYLAAARGARTSSAFAQALFYASRGLDLLPPDAPRSHHALWFALSCEAAEGAYLTGDFAATEARIAAALPRAASRGEELELWCLRLVARAVAQDPGGAIRWGREALARFGLALPEAEDAARAARADLGRVEAELGRRAGEDLTAAPAAKDPDVIACLRLLSKLTAPAWIGVEQGLFSFVVTRMVDLSLRHGITPESGGAFVRFGMILGEARDDFASGYAVSQEGLTLARRRGDARQECRAAFAFAFHMSHWKDPFRVTDALYRRAAAAAFASGELEYAAFSRQYAATHRFVMGAELDQVALDVEDALGFARKIEHHNAIQSLELLRQAVRRLQGRTRGTGFDDDTFDAACFLAEVERTEPALRCRYEIHALQIAYLFGDVAGARARSVAAAAHLDAARGTVVIPEHNVYTSLALAASCDGATGEERRALLVEIAANQRRLGRWAKSCPENYRHKHRLVAAEVARIEGRPLDEALDLYEQAIEGARREGCLQDEALARELAGRCLHARGRRTTASFHLRAAIQAYARWGATAKVQALEEEFRGLLAGPEAAPAEVDAGGGAALDVISLLKATETVASEVVPERLLSKLMEICLEAAGARRAALVLDEGGAHVVRATAAVSEPVAIEPTPLGEADLPRSLVEDVFARGEPVVLAHAARQGRFAADPYVARRGSKSALAVPLRKQARTVGVLYLENDLATHAFTAGRARVLELLSSGIAVAIENSLLFERLTVEIGERARAEQGLRFLAEASALLAESLDYEATLAKVARLAVPFLATWCIVDVLRPDGSIQRVAAAHADPEKEPLLRELCDRYPPLRGSEVPAAVALRARAPYLLAEVTEAFSEGIKRDARHVELVHALGNRSLMAVPLVAGDRGLGAITFFSAVPWRRYGATDLTLAQEVARRAAFAIENARLYHEAQEAIRLREDFLSIASHELFTPITSLQLAVQALTRGERPPSPEHVRRALPLIERQTLRLSVLVGELLDISRIRAGHLELHLEEVDLARVVRECVARLDPQIALARCPLSLRLEDHVTGRWDPVRLAQVVTNLLANAVKFGKSQPIEVAVERRDGTARLVVRDHGIGIEPARLARIFERFERGVSAEHYGGLGLGLFIVREIVGALGGTVHAESAIGAGSTFTVELPREGPTRADPAVATAAPEGRAIRPLVRCQPEATDDARGQRSSG
jgi:predicted ATPase/signal transduction histidine kinase